MRDAERTSLKTRKHDLAVTVALNFLLGCSQVSLDNYELARLGEVADLRKEMFVIFDRLVEQSAVSMLAKWFRESDRAATNAALATEIDPVTEAKQRTRDGQRSDDELLPLPSLPPGAAHLAAALRYAERNIADGLCCVCPKPLDRNSVRYCTKHLAMTRARDQQKKALSVRGSQQWLYAGDVPSTHGRQPGTLASLAMEREKRTRALLAELGIPPEHAAVSINAAKEALLRVMPNSKEKGMTRDELFAMVTIPAKSTGQKALERLLAEGRVQRIGKGIKGDVYRYFTADLDRTKRELASQHAIETAGRHLRGGR